MNIDSVNSTKDIREVLAHKSHKNQDQPLIASSISFISSFYDYT